MSPLKAVDQRRQGGHADAVAAAAIPAATAAREQPWQKNDGVRLHDDGERDSTPACRFVAA